VPDSCRRLLGDSGAALSEREWITTANNSLPPNLSSLKARFESGSRSDRSLQVSYEPSPQYFSFVSLSDGAIAEMLVQTATHCGTFVTSYGCLTLTMRINYLRAGTGSVFVATARVLEMITSSAVVRADLAGDRGKRIASASVAVQFVRDTRRHTRGKCAAHAAAERSRLIGN
jgi:acyl-coenzyme A thioesterase PaaI-like protein